MIPLLLNTYPLSSELTNNGRSKLTKLKPSRKGINIMTLFTVNLGASGFLLDVKLDEVDEGFISSFDGQLRKEGESTVYPKLYWQIVKVPTGINRIGNISFALCVNGSTEPFASLYDVAKGVYREQVARAMNVSPSDTGYDLLVLNGMDNDGAEHVDDNIIALAIKKIETIQNLDVGLTGYFADDESDDTQTFISLLIKADFHKLAYDGFVVPNAVMFFRPQSVLLESDF